MKKVDLILREWKEARERLADAENRMTYVMKSQAMGTVVVKIKEGGDIHIKIGTGEVTVQPDIAFAVAECLTDLLSQPSISE